MKHLKLTLILALIVFKSVAHDPPNFIIILADDQGWNGTSVLMDPNNSDSKSDFYETPNLERLAAMGMRFSKAYAPSPKCSPSRMSIITGQTTARNHFTNTTSMSATGEILIEPSSNTSITSEELTLPEYLKSLTDLNYSTGHFGKWHLGKDLPTAHGYDESDGANSNADGDNGQSINDDPKQIFSLTQKGIDFMTSANTAGNPFFLQLSHYAVHTTIESTQTSFDKYNSKVDGSLHDNVDYAAMTEDLDTGVGLILDFLEELQITDNTYIIYLSDNGGQTNVTSNAPLRLGKTTIFEGGIRVPLIISGPGISANTHSSIPVIGYDLYPTIIELLGENIDDLPDNLDGVSFANILNGSATDLTREVPLIFHSPHYENNPNKVPRSAIVDGNEKLFVEYETGDRLHYDLDTDLEESSNIYIESDEGSTSLLLQLRDYMKSVDAQMPTYSLTDEDTDSDGLPDTWEFEYFLGTLFDGSDDPDGDGNSNSQEYANDTDPLVQNEPTDLRLSSTLDISPFSVYPNPASNEIHFSNTLATQKDLIFELYGLDGHLLLQKELYDGARISIENLPKGIFLYRVLNSVKDVLLDGKLSKE